MRIFEIAILFGLAGSLLALARRGSVALPLFRTAVYMTIIIGVLHAAVEGMRWQMSPAYVSVLLLAILTCDLELLRRRWLVPAGLLVFAGLVSAGFLSTALPIFTFPVPRGPYAIGTQIRHLVDSSRHDPFADDPKALRELVVQIWYPANSSVPGKLAPYRERATTTFRGARFSLVETHARLDAPILDGKGRFPVLIYAPSWIGARTENTSLIEQLVSQGYVVVGVDHPYGSEVVAFPDGRVVRTRLENLEAFSSSTTFKKFIATAVLQENVRAQDASFVLSTLEKINAKDPVGYFTDHLDLSKVGIFGFSFGGGVAAQASWSDSRFRAGIDMDGMRVGKSAENGPPVPFFYMLEDYDPDPNAVADPRERREAEFDRSQLDQLHRLLEKHGGSLLKVKGTRHNNFSDAQLYSPFHINPELGPVQPRTAENIVGEYALAFFDKHLRNIDRPVLTRVPLDTPDLNFTTWPAFRKFE